MSFLTKLRQCLFWIVLCSITGLLSQNVTLSPEIVQIIENGSVTLTCSCDSTEKVTSSRWIYSAASTNPVIVLVNDTCVASGFLNNTVLYIWICHGNNSFSLTLKKVERRNHGETWSCRQKNIESNTVSVYVKVPVNKVEITKPETNVTTLSENSNGLFICTASPARPAATVTWFLDKGSTQSDEMQIFNNVTQVHTTNNEGLLYTSEKLIYAPPREVNGLSLYCIASNLPNHNVESNRVLLNVTYSPDGPPRIQGFKNSSTYRLIEHTVGKLSCSVNGGNPLASLTWECFNEKWTIFTDRETVSAEVTWTASRNQTGSCICRSKHEESKEELAVVGIAVLYPPSIPIMSLRNVTVPSYENIRIIRNNTLLIKCNSSSKPTPTFKWTFPDGLIKAGHTFNIVNFQTSNEGRYLCTAENTMNVSSGDIVTGTSVSQVDVKMLYPPTTPLFRYGDHSGPFIGNRIMDVVIGDTLSVACVSNGQPQPYYSWGNQTKQGQLWSVTSISSDLTKRCIARNMMKETAGESREGQSAAELSVYVLYPPSAPAIKYVYNDIDYKNVSNSISVIEHSSFTLICDAISKPKASYSWYGPFTSTSSKLTLQNFNRAQKGSYACHAFNTMERSFGSTEGGENNTSINIEILYKPDISSLQNHTVIEGTSLNITCPVQRGNPRALTVQWTREGDDRLWHGQHLIIPTVLRNDTMTYTCTVNNTMEPTAGGVTYGRTSNDFHLGVVYKASVVDFFVDGHYGENPVTANENMTVEFRCNIDSNPISTIAISFIERILKMTKNNALALIYKRQSVGCLDAGVYLCTGINEYNYGEHSKKYLTLNVKCFPRPSPNVKIRDIIFTAEQVPATLMFTALAYPVPAISGYKWRKYVGSVWIPLATNDNIVIITSVLQSNLTILNVVQSDYGTYRLDIENSIGIFEQKFTVGPEERPYPPTDFENIEDLNTDSSCTVRWRPGLNGGLAQTFILSYKKTSVQTWLNISIPDNGEEVMNYTLSLASGTAYQIRIYSVNKLGRSAVLDELRIRTKERPAGANIAQMELPVTGIILGTLAALIVVVIVAVVVAIIVRRRLLTSRLNKRLTTTKHIAYENDEENKQENNEIALNETALSDYETPDNPDEIKEPETKVNREAFKKPEPIYEEIDDGDVILEEEITRSQLQQYELISKGKGSVHVYEGLAKRQVRYVKEKTGASNTTDNKTLQKNEQVGVISTGAKYENLRV